MLYYAINVALILFAIRYRINQAIQIPDISCIIIITNTLHTVQKNFDSLLHLYQIQLITIAKELQKFFDKQSINLVKF